MSPEQKAVDKAIAILLTDKNTPILGEFARKISTLDVKSRVTHDQAFRIVSHWATFDREDQFPNEYGIWMDDVVSSQMPDFNLELFKSWIAIGNPMEPPQCLDLTPEFHQPEITCIINDDIVPGKGIQPSKTFQASPEPKQEVKQIEAKVRPTHKQSSKKNVSEKEPSIKVNNQSKKQQVNNANTSSKIETNSVAPPTGNAARRQRQRIRKAQAKQASGKRANINGTKPRSTNH